MVVHEKDTTRNGGTCIEGKNRFSIPHHNVESSLVDYGL